MYVATMEPVYQDNHETSLQNQTLPISDDNYNMWNGRSGSRDYHDTIKDALN